MRGTTQCAMTTILLSLYCNWKCIKKLRYH